MCYTRSTSYTAYWLVPRSVHFRGIVKPTVKHRLANTVGLDEHYVLNNITSTDIYRKPDNWLMQYSTIGVLCNKSTFNDDNEINALIG